jgi:hypothetical protein
MAVVANESDVQPRPILWHAMLGGVQNTPINVIAAQLHELLQHRAPVFTAIDTEQAAHILQGSNAGLVRTYVSHTAVKQLSRDWVAKPEPTSCHTVALTGPAREVEVASGRLRMIAGRYVRAHLLRRLKVIHDGLASILVYLTRRDELKIHTQVSQSVGRRVLASKVVSHTH